MQTVMKYSLEYRAHTTLYEGPSLQQKSTNRLIMQHSKHYVKQGNGVKSCYLGAEAVVRWIDRIQI